VKEKKTPANLGKVRGRVRVETRVSQDMLADGIAAAESKTRERDAEKH